MPEHADTLTKYFKSETSTESRRRCLCKVEQTVTTLEIAVKAEENKRIRKGFNES